METVYLKTNESYKIIYSSESKIFLKDANRDFISNNKNNDLKIFSNKKKPN